MRITSGGNVGIGTTSPSYKLEVNGTNGSIAISGSGYTLNPIPMLIGQYTSTRGYIQVPNQGSFEIWNGGTSAIAEFKNNSQSIFNGSVGIGNQSPFSLLHVGTRPGAGTTNPSLGSIATVSNDGLTGIDLGANVNANNVVGHINWVNYLGVGNYNTARIDVYADGAANSGSLRFWTASASSSPTERMRITSGGNVGIGTTSPTQKLTIAGSYVRSHSLSEDNTNAGAYFQVKSGGSIVGQSSQFVDNAGNWVIYTGTSSESERMRITSGGLVGLGLSSPTEMLHLKDSATGYVGLRLEGSGSYSGSDWTIYSSSISTSTADDFLGFYNNSATDSASAGYKMRIFKSGTVGIGTTTEGFLGKLQVAGSVAITGQYNTVLPSSSFSYFDGSGQLVSSSSNASALYLDTTWNTTGNPDGIYLNVTNTASGASSKLLNLKVDNASQFSVSKGGAIQTSNPTNGTARPWKLGDARSGTISTDSYIIVEVNGVTYSIPALNGLP
jgi:hypothetical protein